MSMSNIEYSSLKKQAGLHNRGYISPKQEFDFDVDTFETADLEKGDVESIDLDNSFIGGPPELLHENGFGEYYALQDFEE